MAYAAYLDAFEAKLKNKGKNSNPFGSPPSAGGINESSNQRPPQSEEEKQATTKAIQDLHADGRNVENMTPEQREDAIFKELNKIAEVTDDISQGLLEATKSYSDNSIEKGSLLKKEYFQEITSIFSKNATNFGKTVFFAVAVTAGIYQRNELMSMASNMVMLVQ